MSTTDPLKMTPYVINKTTGETLKTIDMFEDAIMGTTKTVLRKPQVVYNYGNCVVIIMKLLRVSIEEAENWFEDNLVESPHAYLYGDAVFLRHGMTPDVLEQIKSS